MQTSATESGIPAIIKRRGGHNLLRVRPGLWQIVFHWPATTNSWLWQESDGLTLIDAGHPWNAAAILAAAELLNQPLRRIVITHAHPDHAGAAAELARQTGAAVFAHEADCEFLEQRSCMYDRKGFWLCRAVLKTGGMLGILNAPRIDAVEPLRDGEYVGRLQVMHTPGHTPGSISLWAENARAVFSGDNICSSFGALHVGLPWFTLDHAQQRESLKRYLDVPAQWLLSGHGPAFYGDVRESVKKFL